MVPTWPMARQWVRVLRQPIAKRVDEAVRDDVAADQVEGVYRLNRLSSVGDREGEGEGESVSGDEEVVMQGPGPGPGTPMP